MNTWIEILDWITDYAIYMASTISLFISILTCSINLPIKIFRNIVLSVIFLTSILAAPHFIVFIYYPITLAPIIGIITTLLIIKFKKANRFKIYSVIIYLASCLLYSYAIELSKANRSTWGSSTIYVGIFMIVFILPLLHLITFNNQQDKLYGFFKILTGGILLAICWITKFPPSYELKEIDSHLDLIRYGLIYSILIFTIEGLLLISKNNLQAYLNKLYSK